MTTDADPDTDRSQDLAAARNPSQRLLDELASIDFSPLDQAIARAKAQGRELKEARLAKERQQEPSRERDLDLDNRLLERAPDNPGPPPASDRSTSAAGLAAARAHASALAPLAPGAMTPSPSLRPARLLWRHLAAALLALPLLLGAGTARADVDCPDAGLLGPGLLSSICWECMFPIRLGGGLLATGNGDIPDRAADEPICLCPDALGVPHPGISWGMWEPARLVELVRAPGCSPVLSGIKIEATGELQRGSRGGMLYDKGDRAFYHYHLWAFPLLAMLELFTPAACQRDAGIDMDLLYLSELDPTWIHDELAFFANPESAAVANPAAQAACIADAAAATAGEPLDALFWCAGSWGALYPLSGAHLTHTSMPRTTSLLATRALAAMHRRGLARRTMGSDALCKAQIEPFLPKSQYQLSQAYPRPEANGRHAIGESTFAWGEWRVLPAVGEDFVHLVWRWLDCCLTY